MPTLGHAFDASGRPLTTGPIMSGARIASTTGLLRPPGTAGFPWTMTDHVESAVAERMRRPGAPREVTLVLNNQPCVRRKYGCAFVLHHLIPSGSRLNVYVKDPGRPQGLRFHHSYLGTGKAIAP